MTSQFVDVFSSIQDHLSDGLTLAIELSPSHQYFAVISPTCVGLFSTETDRQLVQKFVLPEKVQHENGCLSQLAWINNSSFVCLTMFGDIILFFISKSTSIMMKSVISSYRFTAISSYNGYIIAGDDTGKLSVISSESPTAITHQLVDYPIKKIVMNSSNGLLLSADGNAYTISLDKNMVFKKEAHVALERIDMERCSSVAISQFSNLGAVFSPTGKIFITDFKEFSVFVKVKQAVGCHLCWSTDGHSLFALFRDGVCSIWHDMTRQIRHFRMKDLNGCTCVEHGRNHLFVATDVGLVNLPLYQVSRGTSPVLYGPQTIVEFRATVSGAVAVTYELPEEYVKDLEQVQCVAGDIKCRFYAVAGRKDVALLSRTSGKWVKPVQNGIVARGMCWLDKTLVLANFDEKSLKYSLEFYQLIPFESTKSIKLPSKPFAIDSDDKCIVVALMDQLMIIDSGKTRSVKIDGQPYLCGVHSQSNSVMVLMQSRDFMIFRNDECVFTEHDVSGFFVDPKFGLMFVVKGLRVFIVSLFKSRIKLSPFFESGDVILGVYPNCSSLMSMQSNAMKPFKANVNQFFDLSIVSEITEPEKAAATVSLMKNTTSFGSLLRQVCVFALRQKLGDHCVQFLEHFPEQKNEVLAAALRAVESPERQAAFDMTGPPSFIFMEFACLSQRLGSITEFHQRKDVSESNMRSAALLLPVIMEEEGPLIGFPAALFILSKLHEDIDYVESLMRFLDPLLSPPVETEDGKFNCVGMILEKSDYIELKSRLVKIVDDCVIDLLVKVKPSLILSFAECFNVNLKEFFTKHQEMDKQFGLVRLMDQLAPLMNNGDLSVQECRSLYSQTYNSGWCVWTLALMLISGDSVQAVKYMQKYPALKHQFQGSQWQHLIDA